MRSTPNRHSGDHVSRAATLRSGTVFRRFGLARFGAIRMQERAIVGEYAQMAQEPPPSPRSVSFTERRAGYGSTAPTPNASIAPRSSWRPGLSGSARTHHLTCCASERGAADVRRDDISSELGNEQRLRRAGSWLIAWRAGANRCRAAAMGFLILFFWFGFCAIVGGSCLRRRRGWVPRPSQQGATKQSLLRSGSHSSLKS